MTLFERDALLQIDLARGGLAIEREEDRHLEGTRGREAAGGVDSDFPPGTEMERVDARFRRGTREVANQGANLVLDVRQLRHRALLRRDAGSGQQAVGNRQYRAFSARC